MALLLSLLLFLAITGYSNANYCTCKDGVSEQALQKALDYACGAGADCTPIQQNGPCFNPNTVKDHCSYAVNSYFQRKGQAAGSCDFSGAATPTVTPPTNVPAGCSYPSTSSNAGTGTTTPATGGGTGVPSTTPPTGTGTPATTTPPTGTGTPATTTPPTGTGTPTTTPNTGTGTGTGTGMGAGTGTGTGTNTGTGGTTTGAPSVYGGTTGLAPTGTGLGDSSNAAVLFTSNRFGFSFLLELGLLGLGMGFLQWV